MRLSPQTMFAVAVFATVGSGLMGGLLFAFSNFVMTALSQQPADSGVRTMQAINIAILNPLFLVVFLGTGLASLVLAVTALFDLSRGGARWLLAGSALYLIGTVGVTLLFNVPLNDRLAAQDPATAAAARFWVVYLSEWMKWNHVRTIAAVVATALLIVAIRHFSSPYDVAALP